MRTPSGRSLIAVLASALLITTACGSEVSGRAAVATTVPATSAGTSVTPPDTEPSAAAPGTDATGTDAPGTAGGTAATGPIEGAIPRPTPGGSGAGDIPAGLAEFYTQQLDWQDCPAFTDNPDAAELYAADGLECTNLVVPLDYADPSGPTVSLGVMRAPATGPDRVGAVQLNPGGPGGSSMDLVASLVGGGSVDALNTTMDLVGFDTRGVGASRPRVSCLTDAEQDAARAANLRTTTPAGIAAIDQAIGDYVQACITNTGRDAGIDGSTFLVNIGTESAAQDMDVLRSALGEEKLSYLGFSYGTLLGAVYADRFPGSVRAMVLDGAVDPQASADEDSVNQAAGFQGAFEAFAAWCAQQAGCPLGTDPAQATTTFQGLVRPLLDEPLPLRDGRTMTFDDAITGTAQALYSTQYWPTLLTGLTNYVNGDGYLLMAIADAYHQRDSSGHYAAILDVFNAVNCMDNERPVPGDTDVSLAEKVAAAAPFEASGDPIVPLDSTCSRWPGARTLDPDIAATPELPTVVVISTTGDPATPYAAGQNLAKQLNGHLITVNGDSHTATFSGIACVDDAVTAYLTDVTVPADGLVCP